MSLTSRSNLRHRAARRAAVALIVTAALAAAAAVRAQLPPPPAPPGNPLTDEKANLGKALFWDEQISSTRTVACGTCHFPEVGGEDPRSGVDPLAVHPGPDGMFGTGDDIFGSPGVPQNTSDGLYQWNTHFGLLPQVTGRRTVSAINAGYAPELFWDGRAPGKFIDPVTQVGVLGLETGAALESQAVGPPVSDVEMADVGRVWTEVLTRIGASEPLALSPEVPADLIAWIAGRSYAELFDDAFGDPAITAPRVAMAIASYERTQFTNQTPYDVWQGGGPPLTQQEQDGLDVFFNGGLCKNCHDPNPPFLFTDHSFRYTGVTEQDDDPGRMDVTGLPEDEGKMRVPMLRNLELRAPFMHNGALATLEDVIEFYDQGGFFGGDNKDPLIVPLNLPQQQKDDLLAFLTRPLTDPRLVEGVFPFDRPTLYTESSREPSTEGAGQPGTGTLVPEAVALEPPLIGNPSFTVGVWNAFGGADAWLVIDGSDPGLTLPVDVGQFAFEMISLEGAGAGSGFGSVSLAIPAEAALDGAEWFGRWYVDDTGGGFDVAVSKLIRFRTFGVQQQTAIFADGFESGDTSAWSATVP